MQSKTLRAMKAPFALFAFAVIITLNGMERGPFAQSGKLPYGSDPASLPIAIAKVEKGNYALVDVEIIARWHAVQVIPALENQFEQTKDLNVKAKIANALIRLGQHDGPYWELIESQANAVLANEPPTPVDYDSNGKSISDRPSKKLVDWANKHQMSVQAAGEYAIFDAIGAMMNLGSSDDKRAIPILRRALGSQDDFIKIAAAQGLAELHDTESIQAIVNACHAAPREASAAIARSLVYFDDATAQQAVDDYLPKDMAEELRSARAHGKTPYR